MVDEKESAPEPEGVPTPDYRSAAPSDWMGSRAVEVMLADLPFPVSVGKLRDRVGNWRVPVRGSEETVAFRTLLEPFDADDEFDSPEDVAKAIGRRFYRF